MAKTNRIITTVAVESNPRIIQSGSTEIRTYTAQQRDADLDRYWKDVDIPGRRRKIFPVEYDQLDKLIKKTGQIALIVKNITDANKVTAKWASFSPAKPPVLNEKSLCFVLSQQYYEGNVSILNLDSVSHGINGISRINLSKMSSNFVVALLGKDETGNITLYLQNATANLIEEAPKGSWDTAPGGEGTGGLKLP